MLMYALSHIPKSKNLSSALWHLMTETGKDNFPELFLLWEIILDRYLCRRKENCTEAHLHR